MAKIIDLRSFLRASGDGVIALVGSEFVKVIDISVAGVRLARPDSPLPHRNVQFRIIPRTETGLDIYRAIPVCGHIVGDGADHVRIAFSSVTTALAHLIDRYQQQDRQDAVVAASQTVAGDTRWSASSH